MSLLGTGSEEYLDWKEQHEALCRKNFEGSAGGALELFSRSMDYNIRYTRLVTAKRTIFCWNINPI